MTERPRLFSFSRRALPAIGLAFFVLLVTVYAFLHAGFWLVREDPLEKSQAIVVLSGGLPVRALAAAEIYRAGHAKEVWLTEPLQPAAAMEELKLPYAGEQEYSRMVLVAKGVPPANIKVLKPKINNTADEMNAVAEMLGSQPGAHVIVVTSKAHTRRVRTIWNQVAKARGRIIVRAAPEDYFEPEHWWRTTNDALTVVREYLGLLNAWAGLPLHHTN
jgi:uncharacterized SAM-binding protein YcdF (DUF218 family)